MVLFFVFSIKLRDIIQLLLKNEEENAIEEIRMRANKPLIIKCQDKEIISDYIVNIEDIRETIELAVEHSVYAHSDEIKNGYITIEGGHRIGVCGQVVFENNEIKTIKHISSINIRVAHEIKGCADKLLSYISDSEDISNTLIISSPGCGKTTLLRDIIRQVSDSGETVGLVDERGEVAAGYLGIPQNDVGIRTDVLSFCKKSKGMIMLIRSMAPKIVVADELGGNEDVMAIEHARNSGCRIIATVHGKNIIEVPECIRKYFDKFILIDKTDGRRRYMIFDSKHQLLDTV